MNYPIACSTVAVLVALAGIPAVTFAQASNDVASAPRLAYKLVENWPQLPRGWNFGECSGVAVDQQDHVWVF
ncbi:MAG: hypothetical protein H5T84_10285, partial [Thermoleophilia bacterium]|nr:hypothetical protein [Thermoleophilia bacterium]